jgi:hypothetical protein
MRKSIEVPPDVKGPHAVAAASHHERYGYTNPIDLYAVESYPEADFQNEPETQRLVTFHRKTIDRRLVAGFFIWVALLFASLLLGVVGEPAISFAGVGLLSVLFIPLVFLGAHDAALDCARCGRRLKKDWAKLASGRSGKFLICPVCHTYVYTHRTLR